MAGAFELLAVVSAVAGAIGAGTARATSITPKSSDQTLLHMPCHSRTDKSAESESTSTWWQAAKNQTKSAKIPNHKV